MSNSETPIRRGETRNAVNTPAWIRRLTVAGLTPSSPATSRNGRTRVGGVGVCMPVLHRRLRRPMALSYKVERTIRRGAAWRNPGGHARTRPAALDAFHMIGPTWRPSAKCQPAICLVPKCQRDTTARAMRVPTSVRAAHPENRTCAAAQRGAQDRERVQCARDFDNEAHLNFGVPSAPRAARYPEVAGGLFWKIRPRSKYATRSAVEYPRRRGERRICGIFPSRTRLRSVRGLTPMRAAAPSRLRIKSRSGSMQHPP